MTIRTSPAPAAEPTAPAAGLEHLRAALIAAAAYAALIVSTRLVVASLATAWWSQNPTPLPRQGTLAPIADFLAAFQLGSAALAVVAALALTRTLPGRSWRLFDEDWAEVPRRSFVTGAARGAVLGLGVMIAFIASGHYDFVGWILSPEDFLGHVAHTFFRALGWAIVLVLEFQLTRRWILDPLVRAAEAPLARARIPRELAFPLAATGFALLTLAFRTLQFDLGWAQRVAVLLLTVAALTGTPRPLGAAGFWAGLVIVLHLIFGQPIFGSEFGGWFPAKFAPPPESVAAWVRTLGRLLTGGVGGPLAGLALQFVVALGLFRGAARVKLLRRKPAGRLPQ